MQSNQTPGPFNFSNLQPPRPFYDSPVCMAGWNNLMAACQTSANNPEEN